MPRAYEDIKICNLTHEIARSKAIAKVRGPFKDTCTACGEHYWPEDRDAHLAVCRPVSIKGIAPLVKRAPVREGYVHVLTPDRRRKKAFRPQNSKSPPPKPQPPKAPLPKRTTFHPKATVAQRPQFPPAVVIASKPSTFERMQAKWADNERRLAAMITEIVQAALGETALEPDPVIRRRDCIRIAQERISALPNAFKRNALQFCEQSKWKCFNFSSG